MTMLKKLIDEGDATHVAPLNPDDCSRQDESNQGPSLPEMAAEDIIIKVVRLVEVIDFVTSLVQGEIPWTPIIVLVLMTKTVRRKLTRFL